MAFQPPPPVVTTWVKVFNDGAQWCWTLDHYGKAYQSGTPPATGPATFNEYSTAAASAEANYLVVRVMRNDERRRERAALSAMTQPSPGQ